MNREQKVEVMESVAENLNSLEGVDEAVLDDYAPATAFTGQIAVILESDEGFKSYDLEADLRSLAQRMRHVLKESNLMNFGVYERPESVYNVLGDPIGHDSNMYMVEVVP